MVNPVSIIIPDTGQYNKKNVITKNPVQNIDYNFKTKHSNSNDYHNETEYSNKPKKSNLDYYFKSKVGYDNNSHERIQYNMFKPPKDQFNLDYNSSKTQVSKNAVPKPKLDMLMTENYFNNVPLNSVTDPQSAKYSGTFEKKKKILIKVLK
jgi:hypothetical protein